MSDDDLLATLSALERRGWDSLCDATGPEFYGATMTEDAVMVLANGAILDRGQVVAALQHSPPWGRYELSDERLIDCGPDAATLVYVGAAYRDADEPAFVGAMSSVYVRAGGTDEAWRLALYQQTPIPPG